MKTSPAAHLDELSLQHRQMSSYNLSGRALHCTSHRRAPPQKTHLIDEPFSILQTDGLLHSAAHLDELSLQHRQMSSYNLSGRALHCTSHRRAPPQKTHLIDEPFSILQTDGLLHSAAHLEELFLQHKQMSSYNLSGRVLHCTSHRRAPPQKTYLIDEPFSILQTDGLLHSVLIDELSLQHRQMSSYHLSGRALHYTSNIRAPPYKSH